MGREKGKAGKRKSMSPELEALLNRHHHERKELRARQKNEMEMLRDKRKTNGGVRDDHGDNYYDKEKRSERRKGKFKKEKKHKRKAMKERRMRQNDHEEQLEEQASNEAETTE